jgi:hypothetical protein
MTGRGLAPRPRAMTEIRELARLATCGQCWAYPGEPCAVPGALPGCHLARFDRACRRGLISGAELAAVLTSAGALASPAAVVYDAREGAPGARPLSPGEVTTWKR